MGVSETAAVIRPFAEEVGINYILANTNAQLEIDLGGIPGMPTAFLIDRNNNLVARHVNFAPKDFYDAKIKSLITAEFSPETEVRILIKRSGNRINLEWKATQPPYELKESSTTDSGQWLKSLSEIQTVDGNNLTSIPMNGLQRFYRLTMP
ncbi:MAG TPA: hypothetical protein EYQ50_07190 [Verrucomicrobiales bacterium]|nr:hypothetical protein [Verrucomicrobiales bacterium]